MIKKSLHALSNPFAKKDTQLILNGVGLFSGPGTLSFMDVLHYCFCSGVKVMVNHLVCWGLPDVCTPTVFIYLRLSFVCFCFQHREASKSWFSLLSVACSHAS